MIEEQIDVPTSGGDMGVRGWRPDGEGPFPVVLCYHHGPGIGEEIYEVARRFADNGFFALTPDLYHRFGPEIEFDLAEAVKPDSEERKRFGEVIAATGPTVVIEDSLELVEVLRDHPAAADGPVGVMGFCHTARPVVRGMAERPEIFGVGAMAHPSFMVTESPKSPHTFAKDITGEIYAGFGADDHTSPLAEQEPLIDELRKLGDRATVDIFDGVDHAFMFPAFPAYDEDATEKAWSSILELFARNLTA